MSNTPPDPEFDLEKLFLPAWAQDSPSVNKYAGYAGEDRPPREHGDRPDGRRPPRRDGGPREGRPPGGRPQGAGGRPQDRDRNRDRGPRPDGPRRDGFRDQRDRPPRREEAPAPLPQLNVTILPDEKGIESLARQIRVSGRAYPLFDIAQLILQKPERQQIRFDVIKKPDGAVAQPLFLCALDDSLWLSEDEAVKHLLNRHFSTFYQTERTPTDPPRGTYTFVGQCGMSGTILGPPNHHDYQNQLHKLHTERFSRMPFEAFKARVKIVKDEAVVKKWIEDQSFKTEYVVLNVPEPLKLPNKDEVEKHFRQVHLGNIVKPVESHTMSGPAARQQRSPELQRLLRVTWDEQRRFPLKVATTLSQQFSGHGLQFFKVNRTVTHVSVARPRYLDLETTPVSDGVKRIVEFINTHPRCTRRKLFETLAPTPAKPVPPPAPAATPTPPSEAAPAEAAAPAPEASPEQTALAGDLHWLIHEGHVIEFANGLLETAKKPLPKPPKPEKKPETAAAPGQPTTEPPATPDAAAPPAAPQPTATGEPAIPDEPADAAEPASAPEPSVAASAPEPEKPAVTSGDAA